MEHVERTGLFTCLREKTWTGLSEMDIEQMAGKFMMVVRQERDGLTDYLSAIRLLEDVDKRLNFWLFCWKREESGGREEVVFFRRSKGWCNWWGWSSS